MLPLMPASLVSPPHNSNTVVDTSTDGGLTLSWRRVSSEATYALFLAASEGAIDDALVATLSETSYDLSVNDLQPETTYYWRVDTHHPCGVVRGQIWSFTTIADDPAGTPVPGDDPAQDNRGCGAFGSGCTPTTSALTGMMLVLGLMRLDGRRRRH